MTPATGRPSTSCGGHVETHAPAMASLQVRLYGESAGGWDEDGRPSARELLAHSAALRRDLAGLCGVACLFGASACLWSDPEPSRLFLLASEPGEQLLRGALGALCALAAGSALAADLLVCPCPASTDPKFRAVRPLGHFCFLTVQTLAIATTHLALSAAADMALDPLVRLPPAALDVALRLHGAAHLHAEWVCALACALALLFYPLALLPHWHAQEVAPWTRRGVPRYRLLQLYSHGIAVPACAAELLLLRRRDLLLQLAPGLRSLALISVLYGCLYPLSVHAGYNLHALRARAAGQSQSARAAPPAPRLRGHSWPYGFMDELTQLGKPPPLLAAWGVRPPFSAGWVLLALVGTGLKLLALLCVRRSHVGA